MCRYNLLWKEDMYMTRDTNYSRGNTPDHHKLLTDIQTIYFIRKTAHSVVNHSTWPTTQWVLLCYCCGQLQCAKLLWSSSSENCQLVIYLFNYWATWPALYATIRDSSLVIRGGWHKSQHWYIIFACPTPNAYYIPFIPSW